MTDATFTFRVDEELKSEFAAAAKARDRSGAQLLRDFMRAYVRQKLEEDQYDAWFRRSVEAAIEAANEGDLISDEEVEADADAWRRTAGGNRSGSR